jgi:hypothetical protein
MAGGSELPYRAAIGPAPPIEPLRQLAARPATPSLLPRAPLGIVPTMFRIPPLVAAVLVVAALAAIGGCMRVPPHRRETLARPDMLSEQPDLVSGEEHARAYREGSSGGGRVRGGGCGCN